MSEQKKHIATLLEKYFSGTCTDEETIEVMNFLDTPEGERYMDNYIGEEMDKNQTDVLPTVLAATSFDALMNKAVAEEEADKATVIKLRPAERPWYFKYAVAGVFFLIAFASFLYINRERLHTIKAVTLAGERQLIRLPDGSEVLLYEKSSLSYSDNFTRNNRNVYLDGEAFFSVSHTKSNSLFTVHTADSLRIKVVGTKFEVSALNGKSRVILEEGKVVVNREEQHIKRETILHPGDMITVRSKVDKEESKRVDAVLYTGRSQKVFALDHTPFEEIMNMLHDIYGYDVTVPDERIRLMAFSGTLPNSSPEDIIKGISTLTGMKYNITGNKVTFY